MDIVIRTDSKKLRFQIVLKLAAFLQRNNQQVGYFCGKLWSEGNQLVTRILRLQWKNYSKIRLNLF